jgi:cytochrome c biogenesis protein CcmG/thiol:disulfide interchange protein DsbE
LQNSSLLIAVATIESGCEPVVVGAKHYCDQLTTGYPLSIFVDKQGVVQNILEGMPVGYDAGTKKVTGVIDDKDFYAALKQIE